jgi:transcription initiation factor TFIIIB Brf1 subunit/transcription initiation factor TFIIB
MTSATIENNNNNNNNDGKAKNCKICGNNNTVIFDYNTGELVCTVCGAVTPEDDEETVATIQDTKSRHETKWGIHKPNNGSTDAFFVDREREAILNYNFGLNTMIYSNDVNHSHDTVVTEEQKQNAFRLHRMNIRVETMGRKKSSSSSSSPSSNALMIIRPRQHKTMIQASNIIYTLKARLNLSNTIVERSIYYFKKVLKANIIKGRTTSGMAIACIYIACREMRLPFLLKNISNAYETITPTKSKLALLNQYYKTIVNELNIKFETIPEEEKEDNQLLLLLVTGKYLNKYLNTLNLPISLYTKAIEVLKILAKDPDVCSRRPSVFEAAVLFYVYKKYEKEDNLKRIITSQFALECGTNEVSMRNNLKFLTKKLDKYLNNNNNNNNK